MIHELPAPYFEDEWTTIYHADVLDILHHLDGIGAVITDPPYSSGGQFRSDRMKTTVEKYTNTSTMTYRPEFSGDNRDQRSFLAWCSLWMNAARRASIEGAPICSFSDWRQIPIMSDAMQAGGWIWRGVATWSKGWGRVQTGRFSNACEFVLWGSNGSWPTTDDDSTFPPGVIVEPPPGVAPGFFEKPSDRDRVHVAEKPIEVMRWLVSVVRPEAVVLDPFIGSGATLRACRDRGLRSIGIDSDERYCEHAANQLAQGSIFQYLNTDNESETP